MQFKNKPYVHNFIVLYSTKLLGIGEQSCSTYMLDKEITRFGKSTEYKLAARAVTDVWLQQSN
jgi:hypothetical protein